MAHVDDVEQDTNALDYKTFEFNGETYQVKKKFKRLKFLRLVNENPFEAFALAFDEAELERLEDKDLTEQELLDLIEIIGKTLLGSSGN
jgi:hypothetical protein